MFSGYVGFMVEHKTTQTAREISKNILKALERRALHIGTLRPKTWPMVGTPPLKAPEVLV